MTGYTFINLAGSDSIQKRTHLAVILSKSAPIPSMRMARGTRMGQALLGFGGLWHRGLDMYKRHATRDSLPVLLVTHDW